MVQQQKEGLRGIAILKPLYRLVNNDRRCVPCLPVGTSRFDEVRVVVATLPWEDTPVVESGRFALQVPFANEGCLIPGLLQELREGNLRDVKPCPVVNVTICMAVLPCEECCPAGCTD